MKRDLAQSPGFRLAAILFGVLVTLLGLIALLGTIGLVPGPKEQTWSAQVFGMAASAVFVCAGAGVTLFGLRRERPAAKAGGFALLAFVLAFNWIAFGPGERQFKRQVTTSWSGKHSSTASELEGRTVFGIVALLMDGVLIYGLVAGRRKKD